MSLKWIDILTGIIVTFLIIIATIVTYRYINKPKDSILECFGNIDYSPEKALAQGSPAELQWQFFRADLASWQQKRRSLMDYAGRVHLAAREGLQGVPRWESFKQTKPTQEAMDNYRASHLGTADLSLFESRFAQSAGESYKRKNLTEIIQLLASPISSPPLPCSPGVESLRQAPPVEIIGVLPYDCPTCQSPYEGLINKNVALNTLIITKNQKILQEESKAATCLLQKKEKLKVVLQAITNKTLNIPTDCNFQVPQGLENELQQAGLTGSLFFLRSRYIPYSMELPIEMSLQYIQERLNL